MGDENNFLLSNESKIFNKNEIGKNNLKSKIEFIKNKINLPNYNNNFKESREKILNKIDADFLSLEDFETLKIEPLEFKNSKTQEFNIKIIKLEKNFDDKKLDFRRQIRNAKSILGINTYGEKVNNFFRENKILIGLAGALGITYLYKKFKK